MAVLSHLIAIEIEGGIFSNGRHVRPSGWLKDSEKYNCATAMGWRLIRVTPDQLISTKTFETIEQLIRETK